MFSLSITNPNGRPMLPFDWLIHSSLILARLRNTFVKQYKPTAKVIYFIYGNMVILQPVIKKGGDSVRSTIAAVVLLQLKFSPPLTNVINCFMAFSLDSSFLTSIFRRNLTNFFALDMEQFEEVLFAPS